MRVFSSGVTRNFLVLFGSLLLVACGGGGGGGGGGSSPPVSSPPPEPAPPAELTSTLILESEPGDVVGEGRIYTYTQVDALFSVSGVGIEINVGVIGDQRWTGNFILPNSFTQIQTGIFNNVARTGNHDPDIGGMDWFSDDSGCGSLTGSFEIQQATFDGNRLTELVLAFTQSCTGSSASLRGRFTWNAADPTSPPGPELPIPDSLWSPPDGSVPETGNYVYLESSAGDVIGQGQTWSYTGANAFFSLIDGRNDLGVHVESMEEWFGTFSTMDFLNSVEIGYYGGAMRYPVGNPVKGSLHWQTVETRCDDVSGWFAVDDIVYVDNSVSMVELRFEQRCDSGPPLFGAFRWDSSDETVPPGPENPPPQNLWAPPDGAVPDAGTYVYLESEIGDYIGQGQNYLYTPADSAINAYTVPRLLAVQVNGNESWNGNFQSMGSVSQLVVGYYGNATRYPASDLFSSSLGWTGESRGCSTLTGWFVVDEIIYDGNELQEIELRFRQACEGGDQALHGSIRWDAGDFP